MDQSRLQSSRGSAGGGVGDGTMAVELPQAKGKALFFSSGWLIPEVHYDFSRTTTTIKVLFEIYWHREVGSADGSLSDMVTVYSPTEHTCLWNTGKVPQKGYFPCTCSVKGDMWTSCDIQWKQPEFCMLVNSPSRKSRKNFARSSLIRSHTRRNCLSLSSATQCRDVNKHLKSSRSDFLLTKQFLVDATVKGKFVHGDTFAAFTKSSDTSTEFSTRNHVVEEPWLSQSSIVYHHVEDSDACSANDNEIVESGSDHIVNTRFSTPTLQEEQKFDFKRTLFDANYPVEEPWLFQPSILSSTSNAKMVPDVSNDEVSVIKEDPKPAPCDQQQPIPENLFPDNDSNLISKEDSVTTVILINSSICTMQRIAVLEDEKLVELLFEPVKNNVLCDSVYLGVVSKLVPHMGGAFVNIGCPRPSFMDIKPNREPFIFLPFHHQAEEGGVNGSPLSKLGFAEDKMFPNRDDETDDLEDDDVEDDDLEDNSDDDFVEHLCLDDVENGNFMVNGVKNGSNRLEKLSGNGLQQERLIEDNDTNNYKTTGANGRKWAPVQKGTKIIVQVVKEGLGTKGPTLTAYPKLRSRFWLLIARSNTIGISKKISGVERTRLRVIAKTLQPPGFGLTVRTVAAGHSLEELQKDLEGLLSTWKSIMEHARSAALASDEGVDGAIPVMLHRALGKTLSVAQDYFTEKVKSMVVDSPRTYHEVTNYLQEIAPNLCDRVELYNKRTPLFDEYKIEDEIDNILSKRVPLTNGGYLVIEQTEALVSIDVNGGQCMLGQGTSQEKAILEVNLAAAKQIARELRLRDVGGIIVVDFIDMMDDSNKRLVYEEVKKAVERDRSTVKVSELSRHGLMEITRKRVRPSVTFMISEPCTCCHGTGRVEALETSFSKIEHEICRMLSMTDVKADPENPKSWSRFILRVDRHMCNYLTSGKRTRLAVLSSSLKVWILLKVARGFTRGGFELKPLTDEKEQNKNQNQLAIPLLRPTDVASYTPTKKISLIPIKKWKASRK